MKKNDLVNRISLIINEKERNKSAAAQRLGYSTSFFSQITTGKASIGLTVIETLLNTYKDLNARWLITGEGEPWVREETTVQEPAPEYKILAGQLQYLQKILDEERAKNKDR